MTCCFHHVSEQRLVVLTSARFSDWGGVSSLIEEEGQISAHGPVSCPHGGPVRNFPSASWLRARKSRERVAVIGLALLEPPFAQVRCFSRYLSDISLRERHCSRAPSIILIIIIHDRVQQAGARIAKPRQPQHTPLRPRNVIIAPRALGKARQSPTSSGTVIRYLETTFFSLRHVGLSPHVSLGTLCARGVCWPCTKPWQRRDGYLHI